MLERIIISKVRVKILKTFLLNTESTYHIRGLVRKLGEEINAIRRELKNLELFGIIKSKKQANKLVYTLNKESIFLPELRSMFLKDTQEVKLVSSVLTKIENIEGAILTQAYINGEYKNENDIDILIIGKPNLNKLNKEMEKVEKDIGKELRMAVLSPEDFEFQKKQREAFVRNILENENVVLFDKARKYDL